MAIKSKYRKGQLLKSKFWARPQDWNLICYIAKVERSNYPYFNIFYEIRRRDNDDMYACCYEDELLNYFCLYLNPNKLWRELNGS